jgi:hypothetical protein
MAGPRYGFLKRPDSQTTLSFFWVCARAFLFILLLGSDGIAAEISRLDVQHREGRYSMHVNALLDAAPESVYQVLTDYDRFSRITDSIQETRVLDQSSPHIKIVYSKINVCFFLICINKEKIERIQFRSDIEILATIEPDRSDFTFGTTHWLLEREGESTRLVLDLVIQPNFWIPPMIGPSIIKAVMHDEGINTARTIEQLAKGSM